MGGSDIKIEPKAQKFVDFDAFLEYCSSSEWECLFKFYEHSMNSWNLCNEIGFFPNLNE